MKFVALVSGGKDSFYSAMECIRNNHELVACAHLSPRKQSPDEDEESYMYQTAGSECIRIQVEECLDVPLIIRECVGRSKNTSLVYDHSGKNDEVHANKVEDEVEDLYELLVEVKRRFPSVQGISSGAILSTYQRTRIESVCSRLGLTSFGYMWRMGPQRNLLECMLKDGLDAVLVKVASPPGLMPQKHLNKSLATLFYGGVFDRLKERFDFHICGEGGEYETLVVDCPIFKKKLVLNDYEIIEGDDGVGIMKINECSAVDKDTSNLWESSGSKLYERIQSDESNDEDTAPGIPTPAKIIRNTVQSFRKSFLPNIRILSGGLAHISEMVCQTIPQKGQLSFDTEEGIDVEAELAVLEAKSIFSDLDRALSSICWTKKRRDSKNSSTTAKDIVFVHLYLADISHFAKINKYYRDFFGTVLPPSRSCVAVGKNVLAGGRRVMLDCMIQRGSGEYMRILPDATLDDLDSSALGGDALFIREQKANSHHKLRSTLHVQTISHWAPVCVGPYSQANTLRSSLIFMAGQIGLNAGTMTLVKGGWTSQLSQCWKNAASVLDALEGSLDDILGGVIYIGSEIVLNSNEVWRVCEQICKNSISKNGGIISGLIDGVQETAEMYGGYEDFETYQEVMGSQFAENEELVEESLKADIPLLMVALPAMPVQAEAEVELICATSRASTCLDMETYLSRTDQPHCNSNSMVSVDKEESHEIGNKINWDTGYNGIEYNGLDDTESMCPDRNLEIETIVRSIGKGCSSIAYTTATCTDEDNESPQSIDIMSIVSKMIDCTIESISRSSGLGKKDILNIRLFYRSSSGDDGACVRSALNAIIGSEWRDKSNQGRTYHLPAISIVPVDSMFLSPSIPTKSPSIPYLAMQTMAVDLVHMETEMWIHHKRSNEN